MIDWKRLEAAEWNYSNEEEYDAPEEYATSFPNTKEYPVNYRDKDKPYCHSEKERFAALMTLKDWQENCDMGCFIDYDGYGALLEYRMGDYYPLDEACHPSECYSVNPKATHVDWFNR
jgi:hypothetical protein